MQGLTNAVLNLNKTDGFFGSDVYKMFLPPDAKKIETTLRKAGMGAQPLHRPCSQVWKKWELPSIIRIS